MDSSQILSLASAQLTWAAAFVGIATVITAVITIIITYYFNRDKKKLIQESANHFLDKIEQNETLRNELINKILKDKNFSEEFERMVDIHISDKMDRISEDIQEKSNIKGLQ